VPLVLVLGFLLPASSLCLMKDRTSFLWDAAYEFSVHFCLCCCNAVYFNAKLTLHHDALLEFEYQVLFIWQYHIVHLFVVTVLHYLFIN
jgi:hypothetical protein